MLRFACGMDPQGAAFGVLKGFGPEAEKPPYQGPTRPGTFCWDELHTKDMAAAKKFYGGVFGWTGKGDEVETLGGKVMMPAMEIPKVGRFSVVQNPTGAAFSPFRPARV